MKTLKTLALSSVAASALVMTACSSTGNYGTMNNATKGTIAGATAGALVKSKGDSKDIARGAVVGAILGGGTGYVIDRN